MVVVNSDTHRFGIVAILATLFAAIYATFGDDGCIFDFESVSDFELECNKDKNLWTANEDLKLSPKKKILILPPEQKGCLKTKNTITLNSTSPVTFRFYENGADDEKRKIKLLLLPKEGSCPDEECVWNIGSDPQYKKGEWITAEYKFPLKSMKEYYVQLEVGKNKGKFLVDSIVFPSALGGDSYRCHSANSEGISAAEETGMNQIDLPEQLINVKNLNRTLTPSLAEFSKNLMLTSASVLTLNNILN